MHLDSDDLRREDPTVSVPTIKEGNIILIKGSGSNGDSHVAHVDIPASVGDAPTSEPVVMHIAVKPSGIDYLRPLALFLNQNCHGFSVRYPFCLFF